MATRDLTLLAARVKQRRLDLGLGRDTAAQSVGMSKDTWHKVERGEPVRESTYLRIEQALRWARGSCVTILDGGEPVEVEESGIPGVTISHLSPVEMKEQILGAAQASLLATTDMRASEIRATVARLREELQSRGLIPPDEPTQGDSQAS